VEKESGKRNKKIMTNKSIANLGILKIAAFAPIIISALLIILKIYGWVLTGSLSIFSSLVDSFLDIIVSTINLFAIFYALKPADEDHRFGHTAIEDIAGLGQAAFIFGAALIILLEGFNQFFNPLAILYSHVGINIMLIVIFFNLALVIFQKYASRKTNSLIVSADSVHYETDVLMNLGIIFSLYLNIKYLDPILAIIIALYISKSAWKIGVRAFNNLMSKEMPEEMKQKIYKIIAEQSGIKGFHQLKTRFSGRKAFIQMHIELSKALSLLEAHHITDKLEHDLAKEFADLDVIIHQDPI
jgi:ferrous-iron efflux pump FieF